MNALVRVTDLKFDEILCTTPKQQKQKVVPGWLHTCVMLLYTTRGAITFCLFVCFTSNSTQVEEELGLPRDNLW